MRLQGDVGIRARVGVFLNAPHLAYVFIVIVPPLCVSTLAWCVTGQCWKPTGRRYINIHRKTFVCPLARTPSGCGCTCPAADSHFTSMVSAHRLSPDTGDWSRANPPDLGNALLRLAHHALTDLGSRAPHLTDIGVCLTSPSGHRPREQC